MTELGLKELVLLRATLGFAIAHAVKTDKPDAVHRELNRTRSLLERVIDELTGKDVRQQENEVTSERE